MLRIELAQEQLQECEICHRRIDGNRHHRSCPYYQLNKLLDDRRELRCPDCLRSAVELLSRGRYQCHNCSRSFAEVVEISKIDPAILYRVGLKDWKRGTEIYVYTLKDKGLNKIPIYVRISQAVVAVNTARRALNLTDAFRSDGE